MLKEKLALGKSASITVKWPELGEDEEVTFRTLLTVDDYVYLSQPCAHGEFLMRCFYQLALNDSGTRLVDSLDWFRDKVSGVAVAKIVVSSGLLELVRQQLNEVNELVLAKNKKRGEEDDDEKKS